MALGLLVALELSLSGPKALGDPVLTPTSSPQTNKMTQCVTVLECTRHGLSVLMVHGAFSHHFSGWFSFKIISVQRQ